MLEAVEGETYDIEAWPGTLEPMALALIDADGAMLHSAIGPTFLADSPPLMRWEAQSTGSHYVAVLEGHPYGSYTLMITCR